MAQFSDFFSSTLGQNFQGAFRAASATIQFGTISGIGLLLQNLSFQYSQQITKIFEIGTTAVYYIIGRARGDAAVGRIVGPNAINLAFLRQFSDGCQAANNNPIFTGALGCNGSTGAVPTSWQLNGCVITAIAVAVQAEQMVISEQLQMTYVALDIQEQGTGTVG
jgi:hypothetical protein